MQWHVSALKVAFSREFPLMKYSAWLRAACRSSVKDLLLPSSQVRQTLVLCFEALILIKKFCVLTLCELWDLDKLQTRTEAAFSLIKTVIDCRKSWLDTWSFSPTAMKARETVVGEEMSQRVTAAVWLLLSPLRAFAFKFANRGSSKKCFENVF